MRGQAETTRSLTPAHVEALFQTYQRKLFKYACRLAQGHTQDAEDLLIETFVCLTQHACAPIEGIEKNPYAYLSRIMTNVFLAERRRQKARRREAELPAGSVDWELLLLVDPTDLQKQQEQQELILQADVGSVTLRLVNANGDVLWGTTQKGSAANVAGQVVKTLRQDVQRLKRSRTSK
jgi:DNA-directed RNA polymerase specialized sigma24 family protein